MYQFNFRTGCDKTTLLANKLKKQIVTKAGKKDEGTERSISLFAEKKSERVGDNSSPIYVDSYRRTITAVKGNLYSDRAEK